jgi:Replicase family
MADALTAGERPVRAGDALALISHVRVSNAVAHFAQTLPFRVRCSDDLGIGLAWAERNVALRHRELAPDPPGWKTALRFDVDCPCDRQPHARSGYCARAATYWRDALVAEPSFIVVNPTNGHAHYVYLLRGWIRIDGTDASELAAVRYFAAIERAYTRALRADAGYAGLVQHNPFSASYETFNGCDEPYSLRELAAFVELPPLAPRRKAEIRTDGRNIETFDRLRFWAYAQIGEYRCGPRETWDEVVAARALAIAEEVRAAHPRASHPYGDAEALDTAKSVAGWVWSRYDGGHLTRVRADEAVRRENDRKRAVAVRRARGALPREVWLEQIQQRRVAAAKLCGLGVAVDEIARRLSAGVRSVQRWISEIGLLVPSAPSPSAPSDFARARRSKSLETSSETSSEDVGKEPKTPERASIRERIGGSAAGAPFGTNGIGDQRAKDPGRGVRGETRPESSMAYIQRRIREITSGQHPRPP